MTDPASVPCAVCEDIEHTATDHWLLLGAGSGALRHDVTTLCLDPFCGHEGREHHPFTGMCGALEQTRRAYVSGDGIHDSELEPCRCGGLITEKER